MASAQVDYARTIEYLSKTQLPPYIAYVAHDAIRGMHDASSTDRIVIRVSDGKIVSGSTHFHVDNDHFVSQDSNPVSNPVFDPKCYRATGEVQATFEGAPALEISLIPTCGEKHPGDNDYAIRTLYANPQTLAPIDARGTGPSDSDSKYVSLTIDERFATFGGHVMPSSMNVDVSGSGLMFWLQVHLQETYTDYQFLNSPSA
jgi:hypothetical protein